MIETTTIMIVGADQAACDALAGHIQAGMGVHAVVVPDAVAARALHGSGRHEVALAIVDARLPGGQGPALCAELAQAHKGLPVLMVSPGYCEHEALESLRAGAIDYFPRPHRRAELLARLRAHLRSRSASPEVQLPLGPFRFHPARRLLVDERRQSRIWLTAKESRILRRLCLANGRPVNRAELLQVGWGSPHTSVHTLQAYIYRLRTKLGSSGPEHPLLLTTNGGYMLEA